jgi:hypothetical protein
VTDAFNELSDNAIDDAKESNNISISNVHITGLDYEVGLVAQGQIPANRVALIHLMPFLANSDQYWHKNLLAAVGLLF